MTDGQREEEEEEEGEGSRWTEILYCIWKGHVTQFQDHTKSAKREVNAQRLLWLTWLIGRPQNVFHIGSVTWTQIWWELCSVWAPKSNKNKYNQTSWTWSLSFRFFRSVKLTNNQMQTIYTTDLVYSQWIRTGVRTQTHVDFLVHQASAGKLWNA